MYFERFVGFESEILWNCTKLRWLCKIVLKLPQQNCKIIAERICAVCNHGKEVKQSVAGHVPVSRMTTCVEVDSMKILTLNTHSLQEDNYEQKLQWFVAGILRELPDVIAMQEVNQSAHAELMELEELEGQYPVPGCMAIRKDNHAARVANLLRKAGIVCYWAWLPVKRGCDQYDEGVAIVSIGRKIRCVDTFPISKVTDYCSSRTRAVLGVQLEGMEDWFYSLHMDWWEEEKNGFLEQWKILNSCVAGKRMCGSVWLLGDFHAPDHIRGQSYDHIVSYGWFDTYRLALNKERGITVPGRAAENGMRLDYIWCSHKRTVITSQVVFNGTREPVVSNHFGVMIEIKE